MRKLQVVCLTKFLHLWLYNTALCYAFMSCSDCTAESMYLTSYMAMFHSSMRTYEHEQLYGICYAGLWQRRFNTVVALKASIEQSDQKIEKEVLHCYNTLLLYYYLTATQLDQKQQKQLLTTIQTSILSCQRFKWLLSQNVSLHRQFLSQVTWHEYPADCEKLKLQTACGWMLINQVAPFISQILQHRILLAATFYFSMPKLTG